MCFISLFIKRDVSSNCTFGNTASDTLYLLYKNRKSLLNKKNNVHKIICHMSLIDKNYLNVEGLRYGN